MILDGFKTCLCEGVTTFQPWVHDRQGSFLDPSSSWINKIPNQIAFWEIIPDKMVKHHGDISFLTSCDHEAKMLKPETSPYSTAQF